MNFTESTTGKIGATSTNDVSISLENNFSSLLRQKIWEPIENYELSS